MNTTTQQEAREWMFGNAKEVEANRLFLFGDTAIETPVKETYTDSQLMDKWRKERGTFTNEEFELISEDLFCGEFLEYCHKWNVIAFQELYHEIKKMYINKKKHELPDLSLLKAKTDSLVRLFNCNPKLKQACKDTYENYLERKAESNRKKHVLNLDDEMNSIALFYAKLLKSKESQIIVADVVEEDDSTDGGDDGDFGINMTASSLSYKPQFPSPALFR